MWYVLFLLYLAFTLSCRFHSFKHNPNLIWIEQLKDSSHPLQVLTRCKDLCLRDRTAANNLVRTCSSIDFKPGKRLTQHTTLPTQLLSTSSSLAGTPSQIEYEESTCYLSREQARPEGLGATISSPGFFLFNEICLSCKSETPFILMWYVPKMLV